MAFNKKNGKTISRFFLKSVLRKTAEFSVSDTGDPLILTCLVVPRHALKQKHKFLKEKYITMKNIVKLICHIPLFCTYHVLLIGLKSQVLTLLVQSERR